jgi:hypothetical protein
MTPEVATCANCRFCSAQKCVRHAPTIGETGFARFPLLGDPIWCGDWQPEVGEGEVVL